MIPAGYRLEVRTYRRAWRKPWRTAAGLWTHREGAWVRLTGPDGRRHYGEVAPFPGFGTERWEAVRAWLEEAAAAGPVAEDRPVPAGWGATAFGLGVSEEPAEPKTYRDFGTGGTAPPAIAVAALLPAGREAVEVWRERRKAGFRTAKWKVGVLEPAEEWRLAGQLVEALPPGGTLRLDANGGLAPELAEAWLERTDAWGERIGYFEEPLRLEARPGGARAAAELEALLRLAERHATPLALDESVVTVTEARAALAAGWPGKLIVKPALAGAPQEVAGLLRELGPGRAVVSSAFETALGFAEVAELAMLLPGVAAGVGTGGGWAEGDRWGGGAVGAVMDLAEVREEARRVREEVWRD